MNTGLQDTRQNASAATNLSAAQTYDVVDNAGSNTPNVFRMQEWLEQGMAAKNAMPIVNPPSEEEIQHQMWLTSGLVGLVAALVSGSAAGGIAGGMTAALAVHDRGYDLRQRGESVMELHNQGYSKRAILDWYETGDNKELDKERDNMQKMATDMVREASEDRRADQNDRRLDQADRRADQQDTRIADMARHQLAMENKQIGGGVGGLAGLGHLNSMARGLLAPVKDTVTTLGKKQNYLDQMSTNIGLLEKGNPVARNALLTAVAGLDNSNISPTEGAIERLAREGGIPQQMADWLTGKATGTMSTQTLQQFKDFAAAHQNDVNMQRQRVFNNAYSTARGELQAVGAQNAEGLAQLVAQQVASGQVDDGGQPQSPSLMTAQQQTTQAGSQQSTQSQQAYPDGTVIKNQKTGQRMIMKNGKWEDL